MDALADLLHAEPARRLGWVLIHFLWQGAVLAGLLGIAFRIAARRSPQARYLLACLVLLAMAGAPVVTFVAMRPPQTHAVLPVPAPLSPAPAPSGDLVVTGVVPAPAPYPTEALPTAAASASVPGRAGPEEGPASIPARRPWAERMERVLPGTVAAWLLGVGVVLAWHLAGWWKMRRMRRKACPLADGPEEPTWRDAAERLTRIFGLRRPIRLLRLAGASTRDLAGPVVVGVLRPAVLIPSSVLTGLAPWQVEAILAHELAHVRRHDFLVNLVQTGIEILLFYHPAVWWVSARIRSEREACCDDVAAELVGDRRGYVVALAALAEIMATPAAKPVSGFGRLVPGAGTLLLTRIRRLLGVAARPESGRATAFTGAAMAALATVVVIGCVAMGGRSTPAFTAATIETRDILFDGYQVTKTPDPVIRIEITDPDDLDALLGFFPQMGRRTRWEAGVEPMTLVTLRRADGTTHQIQVSLDLSSVGPDTELIWSEGRGWWPVRGDLAGYVADLREPTEAPEEVQPPAGVLAHDLLPVADASFAPLEGLAEGSAEAQQRQRQAAEGLGLPLEVQSARTGIRFRLVPAGTFTMGSPDDEQGRFPWDGPQTRVTLTRPMYVGRYPVTQGQWERVMGRTVRQQRDLADRTWPLVGEGPDHPIYYVSWTETEEFLRRLCDMEGVPEGTYRLLTEAEWEYACRAGTQTPYYTGTTEADLDRAGWYGANSRRSTRPVGLKLPNAWGLFDMHGNVREWCRDRYADRLPGGAVTDPAGPGSGLSRVFRGGNWGITARGCRSAIRAGVFPEYLDYGWGFRIGRVVPAEAAIGPDAGGDASTDLGRLEQPSDPPSQVSETGSDGIPVLGPDELELVRLPDAPPLRISVDRESRVRIEDEEVADGDLVARLQAILEEREGARVFIMAEPATPFAIMVRLMDVLRAAGAGPVTLHTIQDVRGPGPDEALAEIPEAWAGTVERLDLTPHQKLRLRRWLTGREAADHAPDPADFSNFLLSILRLDQVEVMIGEIHRGGGAPEAPP